MLGAALVLLLYALHQDLWFWRTASPLVLGVLPIGLAYHVAYCVAVALVMWVLVRREWPALSASLEGVEGPALSASLENVEGPALSASLENVEGPATPGDVNGPPRRETAR